MTDILADVTSTLRGQPRAVNPLRTSPLARKDIVRHGKQSLVSLSTKWRTILTLELQGRSKIEVAEHLCIPYGTVVNITNSDKYREFRDEMLLHFDQDFLNLKPLAYVALRQGLTSVDEKTASANARWYFETLGYGAREDNAGVTAEDVIAKLFENANVTIEQHAHVHVNGVENGQTLSDGTNVTGTRPSHPSRNNS